MDGIVQREWDKANKIVMHQPGIEMFFGLLEPYASLYERMFDRHEAVNEHKQLQHIFRTEYGIEVLLLQDQIIKAAENDPAIKEELIDMAFGVLEFHGTPENVARAQRELHQNIRAFPLDDVFRIILLQMGVYEQQDEGNSIRNIQVEDVENVPLDNLYFMRDQQITTDKGIVIMRMTKPARRFEPKVTRFLWEKILKVPVIHEIEAPGHMEGGEFIPFGDFALQGLGDRTNQDAVDQLLRLKLGYEEIGVVHQAAHPLIPDDKPDPMINMHLDTYFEVASHNVVVACEDLIKAAKMDIYKNDGQSNFVLQDAHPTLYDYIRAKGFEVVNITVLEQMAYAANFLAVGDGKIVAVEVARGIKDVLETVKESAKQQPERYGKLYEQAKKDYESLKRTGQFFPHKPKLYELGVEPYAVNLKNLTGGYGAAHCMTQVINRG